MPRKKKSDTTNDVKEKPAGKKKQGERKTKSKTSSARKRVTRPKKKKVIKPVFIKPKFIGKTGVILSFYRSDTRRAVVDFPEIPLSHKSYLIGSTIEWVHPKNISKRIIGKVIKLHGRAGHLLVRFSKGLPGQALATQIRVIS